MVGFGVCSPHGRTIAVVLRRGGRLELWRVEADGSGFRQIAPSGFAAAWSSDGCWLYYTPRWDGEACIERIALEPASRPSVVRRDALLVAKGPDGGLYFARRQPSGDYEIHHSPTDDGPSRVIGVVDHRRLPVSSALMQATMSPDGRWLALPLRDGATTNIWLIPTAGGLVRQVTDFGDRTVTIARRVDWSPDGQFIYAAIADVESDIVLYDGLV